MTDNRPLAETIVRDTFARKVRQATEERDNLMAVLARCDADTLSQSDLELLAADRKGFCALVSGRIGPL